MHHEEIDGELYFHNGKELLHLKYTNWMVRCGPPECGGDLILDFIDLFSHKSHWPPDNITDWASKNEAIKLHFRPLSHQRSNRDVPLPRMR